MTLEQIESATQGLTGNEAIKAIAMAFDLPKSFVYRHTCTEWAKDIE